MLRPTEQALHEVLFALGHDFHGSIESILDVSGQAQLSGFPLRGSAEKNPLDPPADYHLYAFLTHCYTLWYPGPVDTANF